MRYELKYSVSHLSPEAIREELLTHPASFTELFPDRQVNNIYFDSSIFHCFHQNVEGHPRRKKMRLRWYGKEALPLSGSVLEIKQKDKELGWKDSYKVESSITDSATLMDAVSKQGMSSTDLQPVLKNTYLRSYLISHEKQQVRQWRRRVVSLRLNFSDYGTYQWLLQTGFKCR